MSTLPTLRVAVAFCLVLVYSACAAERLETRDPTQGPTHTLAPTTAILRPTDLSGSEKHVEAPAQSPTTKATYSCPMHPEVQSAQPGQCPKCGMNLIKAAPSP